MIGRRTSADRQDDARQPAEWANGAIAAGCGFAEQRDPRPASAGARQPIRERKLVLVIEDDVHDREIYGMVLLYNGFDVAFAADAASGLRIAAKHRPDLVLLDIGLPDMTGLELCEALRGANAGRRLPIVVLSAYAREEMGSRSVAAGADEFIEKPASPVAVLHTVEDYLGQAPLSGDGAPPRVVAELS